MPANLLSRPRNEVVIIQIDLMAIDLLSYHHQEAIAHIRDYLKIDFNVYLKHVHLPLTAAKCNAVIPVDGSIVYFPFDSLIRLESNHGY